MKQLICTALVILGLVFQPFAFARSASLSRSDTGNSMQMDQTMTRVDITLMEGDSMDLGSDAKAMPCHEAGLANTDMEDCNGCCDEGCAMIAHCIGTSAVSLANLQTHYQLLGPDPVQALGRATLMRALLYSALIYHPPIHS